MRPSYLLIVTENHEELIELEPLLLQMENPEAIAVAHSVDEAVTWIRNAPPYLMIVVEQQEPRMAQLVEECRQEQGHNPVTIVGLSRHDNPTWGNHEANPGFDGFLVHPISPAVLLLLIQSAQLRQTCYIR
ncbi:MAG: response regulator [Prochlorothrix sp.]|nr:response regulator [Prochlorothrix sp.]